MVESKTENKTAAAAEKPAAEKKADTKTEAVAFPSPSEWEHAEEGINGGPATIDNPPKSSAKSDDKK